MTSSLVGSEMCIRDSPQRHDQLPRGAHRPAAHCQDPLWYRIAAGLLAAPVSYTHLTLPTICSV
eukprot:1046708-Prorocentrum_lima.AAC.1